MSLHVNLTVDTHHLIDARALARMRPTAVLVNTSRGPVVDTDALAAALRDGTIWAAALDVTDPEPLPADHPFWTTPGITVLPHLGGLHPTRDELVAALFVDNLRRFLDGTPLRHVVDRTLGY